jgi:hypothetical protein
MDNVDGDSVIVKGPKITRRINGEFLKKTSSPDDEEDPIQVEDDGDEQQETVDVESTSSTGKAMKVRFPLEPNETSQSGDVIFTPYTDGTQYACRRDALANLRRRMPDFDVFISDVSGEGQIDFTLTSSLISGSDEISFTARGLASPYEMAVHSVVVDCGSKRYNIEPPNRARSPEDTADFLKKLAVNCASGSIQG